MTGKESVLDYEKVENGGMYAQAPAEYGGLWYVISPFNQTPWEQFEPEGKSDEDQEFEEIFGERPKLSDFSRQSNPVQLWQVAKGKWEQDRKQFQSVAVPAELQAAYEASSAVAEAWELGEPRVFGNNYGLQVAFPDADVPYQTPLELFCANPHLVVADYQVKLVQLGLEGAIFNRHPFVPPHVWE